MTTRVTLCRPSEAQYRFGDRSLIGELGPSRVQILKTGDVDDNGNFIWQLQLVQMRAEALAHPRLRKGPAGREYVSVDE